MNFYACYCHEVVFRILSPHQSLVIFDCLMLVQDTMKSFHYVKKLGQTVLKVFLYYHFMYPSNSLNNGGSAKLKQLSQDASKLTSFKFLLHFAWHYLQFTAGSGFVKQRKLY